MRPACDSTSTVSVVTEPVHCNMLIEKYRTRLNRPRFLCVTCNFDSLQVLDGQRDLIRLYIFKYRFINLFIIIQLF